MLEFQHGMRAGSFLPLLLLLAARLFALFTSVAEGNGMGGTACGARHIDFQDAPRFIDIVAGDRADQMIFRTELAEISDARLPQITDLAPQRLQLVGNFGRDTGALPLLTSAFFTHSCSACGTQPIFSAIGTTAADHEG